MEMGKGKFYLADELGQCLRGAQREDAITVGSLVDIESSDFNKLMQILKVMEQRGVRIESLNEPYLSGKPFSKLEDSIAILSYFKGK